MDQLRVYNRYLFNNRLKTSGRNLRLGNGGLGLVLYGSSNKDGMKVLAPEDIANLSKKDHLAFQVGKENLTNLPSGQIDKTPVSTFRFRLGDIVGVRAEQGAEEVREDEFLVGYNGIDEDTALEIPEGETRKFEVEIKHGLLSTYSGNEEPYLITINMHREEGQTMQEVVTKAIEGIKDQGFSSYDNYDKIVEFKLIDNTSEVGLQTYKFYELDLSNSNESQVPLATGVNPGLKGFVQSQYDDFDIKELKKGKYSVMLLTEDEAPEAFEMPSINVISDSCEGCEALAGYEATGEGYVYSVKMADGGTDKSAGLVTAFGAGATAEKLDNKEGVGVYAVLSAEVIEVTELELEGAEVLLLGHTKEVCIEETSETYEWTETDAECTSKTEVYNITLPDTVCGEDRLDDLKAEYDNDTVAVEGSGGCNTKYTMEIVTNVVCQECDDIYLDTFNTEEPIDFEGTKWKLDKEWDEAALMGFRVKAVRTTMIPPSYLQGKLGNINSASEISVSAGICEGFSMTHTNCPEDKDINVMKVSTNKEPVNMGYQLSFFERRDNKFGGNINPHADYVEQYLTGTTSLIEPDKQYRIYSVKVMDQETHDFANEVTFKIPVKVGYGGAVEDLLNALAGKLGLDPVKSTKVIA